MVSHMQALLDDLGAIKRAVEEELLRLYPVGTEIRFTISHGQRNASTGTVVGVGWAPGALRVQHHEAKPHGRYRYRDVHYTHVME